MNDHDRFVASVSYANGWSRTTQPSFVVDAINGLERERYVTSIDDGVHRHEVIGRQHGCVVVADVAFDLAGGTINPRVTLTVFDGTDAYVGRDVPYDIVLFEKNEFNVIVDELLALANVVWERDRVAFHANYKRNTALVGRPGWSMVIDHTKFYVDVFSKPLCPLTRPLTFDSFIENVATLDVLAGARRAREELESRLLNINTFDDVVRFMNASVVYVDADSLFVNSLDCTGHTFIMHDGRPLLVNTSAQLSVTGVFDDPHVGKFNLACDALVAPFVRRAKLVETLSNDGSPASAFPA